MARPPPTAYQPPIAPAHTPHPYARYPYTAPTPPPSYVGPAWAAPGPRREIPPKRKGGAWKWGCVGAVLIVGFWIALGGVFLAMLATSTSGTSGSTSEDDQEAPVRPPTRTPLVMPKDPMMEGAWSSGVCDDTSKERTRAVYYAYRNQGSARVLLGNVAVVHVRLGTPTLKWTRSSELKVDRAALLSQRFLLTQVARYTSSPLRLDVIPWSLRSDYSLPPLAIQPSQLLDPAQSKQIAADSRLAIEMALGGKLEGVVADFKAHGYDEVAFVVYFAREATVRDWALPAYRGLPKGSPEAAYVFSPSSTAFGWFGVQITHETLHLFGADDLYRMQRLDPDDTKDVMDAYCSGFAQARLGASTAYAIGWRAAPPTRSYAFEDW